MPKVSVCLAPELLHHYWPFKGIIVVIDVLRATSTACAAFDGGVRRILTAETVEAAFELKRQFPNAVLVGERDGTMIEGFDVGNSPEAFLSGAYAQRDIILTTTNGTRTLIAAEQSGNEVWLGALINYQAIIEQLNQKAINVLLCCAGWKGRMSTEDTLCAGLIAQGLLQEGFEAEGDEVFFAIALAQSGDIETVMKNATHRKRLMALGFGKDVDISLNHRSSVIPTFFKGVVEVRNSL